MMDERPSTLTLPMPRWPYLWPLLAIPAYMLNPALGLVRTWNGSLGLRVLGIAMLTAGIALGVALSLGSLATRYWRELSLDSTRLLLTPLVRVPHWIRWLQDPTLSKAFRDHHLEIPRAQASLEWGGKSLLLHGHPDRDVHLGRGARAEQIAQWLITRGFPEPVGR